MTDERRDICRQVGIYTYTRYLVRQMAPDGRVLCCYCGATLTKETRTLDHLAYYGSRADRNTPSNLVAACDACNAAAGSHDEEGWARLVERVAELGISADAVEATVYAVLAAPMPERSDPRVQALAWEWFGPRIVEQRRMAAERRERRTGRPATYSTGQLPFPEDNDAAEYEPRQGSGDEAEDIPF